MFLRLIFILLFFCSLSSAAPIAPPAVKWDFVEKKLKAAKFNKSFISTLKKSYTPDSFVEVIELNTLLFLRKSDYHGPQVSDEAINKVTEFMITNQVALAQAEKTFKVDGAVIASLLFIESRYGKNTGTFDVGSVYAHMVQLERPEVVKYLHLQATQYSKETNAKTMAKISEMASRKSKWSMEELKALNAMFKKDRENTLRLKGSFSGAFGIAQFIPSSFLVYAKSKNNKVADLTKVDDAIVSVANYLKKSGWKKSKTDALLKYNNSLDYANAILKLAEESKSALKRTPSNASRN